MTMDDAHQDIAASGDVGIDAVAGEGADGIGDTREIEVVPHTDSTDAVSAGRAEQGSTWADEGDTTWADEEAIVSEPAPSDPWVGVLLVVVMSVVVVLLGTTAALFLFMGQLNHAPRTVAERDVSAWEAAVRERPDDASAWSSLAYAYSAAGRDEEALQVIRRAERLLKQDSLLVIEADVLRAAGRYRSAIKVYDRALKAVIATQERARKELLKKGIGADLKDDSRTRVYLGRGITKYELGDVDGAISDLEKALKESPEMASVAVTLGDYYAELGNDVKAAENYRYALKYVPDYAEALAGLKSLKGGK